MRIRSIFIRIIRQFIRDKRTLGLMLIAPIFVLTLMNLVFSSDDYVPTIGVHEVPAILREALEESGTVIEEYSREEALTHLEDKSIDAFFELENMLPHVILEGSNPNRNMAVMSALQKSLQSLQPTPQQLEPQIEYLHGSKNMVFFDFVGPVLIGFFIFFFVFLIAGVAFLRERTSGTLERLLATPVKRWEIVIGYVIGFGLFTTFQASLISWYSTQVLGIMMQGSFFYVLLVTFLLAMTALTLGTLLSAFAHNELQMIQFIPLVIVPQVFFSGLFPLESMAEWLRSIGVIMPLTYGAEALREVMIRGQGWSGIAQHIYILLGFSTLFLILNVWALKKHRPL